MFKRLLAADTDPELGLICALMHECKKLSKHSGEITAQVTASHSAQSDLSSLKSRRPRWRGLPVSKNVRQVIEGSQNSRAEDKFRKARSAFHHIVQACCDA